jgi:excisionase family DNA binding protein
MITKDEILAAGSSALTIAIDSWLEQNREQLLQLIADAFTSAASKRFVPESGSRDPKHPHLTPAEVAERWGCCVHTVLRKIRSRELCGLMLSRRRILISREEVLKFERDASTLMPKR